jgi:hypothetical protein
MADYYSPTVIDPQIPLDIITPLEKLVLTQILDEPEIYGGKAYFYTSTHPCTIVSLADKDLRDALEASKAYKSRLNTLITRCLKKRELGREIDIEWTDGGYPMIFQDVLRRSTTLRYITVHTAWTCSKMRPDGFGGSAMLITAKRIFYISTADFLTRMIKRHVPGESASDPSINNLPAATAS